MTIRQVVADRDYRRHTRAGGYPVFMMTSYDIIIAMAFLLIETLMLADKSASYKANLRITLLKNVAARFIGPRQHH
jgi:hypothetical protein